MKRVYLVFIIIFQTLPVYSSKIDFNASLKLAHSYEESINSTQSHKLLEAQGNLVNYAFPHCMNITKQIPINFSVVVKLNAQGKVTESWLNVNKPFSECFRKTMVTHFKYIPNSDIFYTAFEYSNAEP